MRARMAQDDAVQRVRHRVEQGVRESKGQDATGGVAIARGLLARDPTRHARQSNRHNPPDPRELCERSIQLLFREFFAIDAQPEFRGRQIAEPEQQIVDVVGMPDTRKRESRKCFGNLVDGLGLEQRPIVRGANQLFELAVVERKCLGATFGKWGIGFVDKAPGKVEQHGLRKWRGRIGFDLDNFELAGAMPFEDLAQTLHIEDIGEAFAVGFEQDWEARKLTGDLEQVARLLSLHPQGRAPGRTLPRQQQRAGGVLAKTRGEHRGVGQCLGNGVV